MENQKRLYLVTRANYKIGSQAAQCTHAASQYLLDNPDSEWKNDHVVLLECDNLDLLIEKMRYIGIPYTAFREPDFDNEISAIATYKWNKLVDKLRLIGSK